MIFKKYNQEFKCKRISKMHFDDIRISKAFENHPPKQNKLIEKAIRFGNRHKLSPIIVDENYTLVDGYCTYLIAKGYSYRGIWLKIYMAKGLNLLNRKDKNNG